MMNGITTGSPERLTPGEQRRFQELDERYSNWRDLAAHAQAEITASQRNMRNAQEQREHLRRLAELIKRDTEQLSNFTREFADILLGREPGESLGPYTTGH
jgi:chromosome segregation ATPase